MAINKTLSELIELNRRGVDGGNYTQGYHWGFCSTRCRRHLSLRRGWGFKLQEAGKELLDFVTFMEQHRASYVTQALALAWAQQPVSVQSAHWGRDV